MKLFRILLFSLSLAFAYSFHSSISFANCENNSFESSDFPQDVLFEFVLRDFTAVRKNVKDPHGKRTNKIEAILESFKDEFKYEPPYTIRPQSRNRGNHYIDFKVGVTLRTTAEYQALSAFVYRQQQSSRREESLSYAIRNSLSHRNRVIEFVYNRGGSSNQIIYIEPSETSQVAFVKQQLRRMEVSFKEVKEFVPSDGFKLLFKEMGITAGLGFMSVTAMFPLIDYIANSSDHFTMKVGSIATIIILANYTLFELARMIALPISVYNMIGTSPSYDKTLDDINNNLALVKAANEVAQHSNFNVPSAKVIIGNQPLRPLQPRTWPRLLYTDFNARRALNSKGFVEQTQEEEISQVFAHMPIIGMF